MTRDRLTEAQWAILADLFPPPMATGRPLRNRRDIVDAIFRILRTGAAWRDLPEEYGPWATAWDLFDRWNADGMLERRRDREINAGRLNGELWCVEVTIVRTVRCAEGGGKKAGPPSRNATRWAVLVGD